MNSIDTRSREITSRNHARIRRIRALQDRKEREQTGLFFVEGIRFVAQAVESRARIETLLVAPQLLVRPFGKKLVRELRRKGVPCLEVTPEVFHSLALTDDPQGLGAVVRQSWEPLSRVNPAGTLCWVALSAVQSAGNLGTIIRTCDAVGCEGLILIGDGPDPYDPAAVRATMGALFAQRFVRTSMGELLAWKERHGCLLVGTSPGATVDYQAVAYRPPVVLFMGWERQGLSLEHQALCEVMVRIPMVGSSDSLNVAIATGVMLYEVFNQYRGETDVGQDSSTGHQKCQA
jgi:RNA methyltransferase, TrmH family